MDHNSSCDGNVLSEIGCPLWVVETGEYNEEIFSWSIRPCTDAGHLQSLLREKTCSFRTIIFVRLPHRPMILNVRKKFLISIANLQTKNSYCFLRLSKFDEMSPQSHFTWAQMSATKWFLRDWIAVAQLDAGHSRRGETENKTEIPWHRFGAAWPKKNEQNKHWNRKHLTQRRQWRRGPILVPCLPCIADRVVPVALHINAVCVKCIAHNECAHDKIGFSCLRCAQCVSCVDSGRARETTLYTVKTWKCFFIIIYGAAMIWFRSNKS